MSGLGVRTSKTGPLPVGPERHRFSVQCAGCGFRTLTYATWMGDAVGKLIDTQGFAPFKRDGKIGVVCAKCKKQIMEDKAHARSAKDAWARMSWIDKAAWTLAAGLSRRTQRESDVPAEV